MQLTADFIRIAAIFNLPGSGTPPPEDFRQYLLQMGVPNTEIFKLWDQGLQLAMQSGMAPSQMTEQHIVDIANIVFKDYQQGRTSGLLGKSARRRFAKALGAAVRLIALRKRADVRYPPYAWLRKYGGEKALALWDEVKVQLAASQADLLRLDYSQVAPIMERVVQEAESEAGAWDPEAWAPQEFDLGEGDTRTKRWMDIPEGWDEEKTASFLSPDTFQVQV